MALDLPKLQEGLRFFEIAINKLTPNIVEHPSIANKARDLSKLRCNSANRFFSGANSMLEPGPPVQKWHYKLEGILYNLVYGQLHH